LLYRAIDADGRMFAGLRPRLAIIRKLIGEDAVYFIHQADGTDDGYTDESRARDARLDELNAQFRKRKMH
jgi:hypothetical protein